MRTTRSKAKHVATANETSAESLAELTKDSVLKSLFPSPQTRNLPETLTIKDTSLSARDHQLLQFKQRNLRREDFSHPAQYQPNSRLLIVAQATLVFAQEAAGTAVCISPDGLLLTCSHCVSASREELEEESRTGAKVRRWLLFASGIAVQAELVTGAWDDQRDLALLNIVGAQRNASRGPDAANSNQRQTEHDVSFAFPYVNIAVSSPRPKDSLICIGHPGSEDLEASIPGLATGYDVLHISEGQFRGYARGQDLQDNSEIGALKHDCWTYWGHSGAPLIDQKTGKLVGLHSSWDEETLMRRGVPLEAVRQFLQLHTALAVD
ncbi:MAG: hypothetical protein M1822_006667 [Bathelium mastoideum]|nr:MAG: hypothetical protein M1822_006667 [Bathelium mastoideum]